MAVFGGLRRASVVGGEVVAVGALLAFVGVAFEGATVSDGDRGTGAVLEEVSRLAENAVGLVDRGLRAVRDDFWCAGELIEDVLLRAFRAHVLVLFIFRAVLDGLSKALVFFNVKSIGANFTFVLVGREGEAAGDVLSLAEVFRSEEEARIALDARVRIVRVGSAVLN